MPITLKNRLIAIALLVLATAFAVQDARLRTAHRHTAELALHVTNLEAERDTTRELRSVASDTTRAFARQVVQVPQRRDAVDRTLSSDRMASYAMKLRVDTVYLRTVSAAVVRETVGPPAPMHFDVRQAPYTVAADLDAHADSNALRLSIAMDPIPLAARIECGKTNTDGIRSASLLVSTPKWASLQLERVEQAPEVCRSPALHGRETGHLALAPLVLGAGRLFGRSGGYWGAFVGAGIRIR